MNWHTMLDSKLNKQKERIDSLNASVNIGLGMVAALMLWCTLLTLYVVSL